MQHLWFSFRFSFFVNLLFRLLCAVGFFASAVCFSLFRCLSGVLSYVVLLLKGHLARLSRHSVTRGVGTRTASYFFSFVFAPFDCTYIFVLRCCVMPTRKASCEAVSFEVKLSFFSFIHIYAHLIFSQFSFNSDALPSICFCRTVNSA